jgi:hypothetical protein
MFRVGESDILRWNERLKAISALAFNLGGGLLAAAVVRLYGQGTIDLPIILWSLVSALLIWSAYLLLGLLQSESVL